MRPIRVLIADDHAGMLAAMVGVLEEDQRFIVSGTATTGDETVEAARTTQVDVVLLDVNMPGGGAETASTLTATAPAPVVVAISAHLSAASIEEMVRAGAVGYLAKGRVGDALPDILARCYEGEVVLASPAAAGALRSLVKHPSAVRTSPQDSR